MTGVFADSAARGPCCSSAAEKPSAGSRRISASFSAIPGRVRFLGDVDAEVDGAHDAVAEPLVNQFLDGAAVHLKGFVEAVDGRVGGHSPV